MKTAIKTILSIIAISFVFASCNKYEDGPKISLRTKKARVAGDWKIEQYTINGTDYTSLVTGYQLNIEKDGTYKVTWDSYTDSGTWELGEDKDDLRMKSNAAGSTENSSRILRLKNKELWLKYTSSNGDVEITHYIPQ